MVDKLLSDNKYASLYAKEAANKIEVIGGQTSMNYYNKDRCMTTDYLDILKFRQEGRLEIIVRTTDKYMCFPVYVQQ